MVQAACMTAPLLSHNLSGLRIQDTIQAEVLFEVSPVTASEVVLTLLDGSLLVTDLLRLVHAR